jgi:serine/threonine-protein kinase
MSAYVEVEIGRQPAPLSHIDETDAKRGVARYRAGSVLCGKYRLDALIGEGAMGAVWQATNLLLDAPVAIKLTHAELDGAFRERLQLEARAAAGLVHPAIVRVFDVAETELGDPFIVMELLQGSTLAQLLKGARFTAVRAVQVILPIVDALSTMHSRGVVHRDLKPDNLLVSFEDQRVQPKVLDFGIAKLNAPRAGALYIDESGARIGSPEYMSPEQVAASDDVDYAADIWAICVVLYEAVAGETPFHARTTEAVFRGILRDEPASLAAIGVTDERLWGILGTGLSKSRQARQKSMSVLGGELAGWLLAKGVHEDACGTSLESKWFGDSNTTPARPRHAPRIAAVCALVGSVALAFCVGAQKRSLTPVDAATTLGNPRGETAIEHRADARPASVLAVDGAMVHPISSVVETTPAVSPIPATAAGVAARAAFAVATASSNKHKDPVRAPSPSVEKPAAKTNGTDLGLLSPY